MDKGDPSAYFTKSGWTAAGAPADDMDAQRVCATDFAKKADKALDDEMRENSGQSKVQKKPAAQKKAAAKKKTTRNA